MIVYLIYTNIDFELTARRKILDIIQENVTAHAQYFLVLSYWV